MGKTIRREVDKLERKVKRNRMLEMYDSKNYRNIKHISWESLPVDEDDELLNVDDTQEQYD